MEQVDSVCALGLMVVQGSIAIPLLVSGETHVL